MEGVLIKRNYKRPDSGHLKWFAQVIRPVYLTDDLTGTQAEDSETIISEFYCQVIPIRNAEITIANAQRLTVADHRVIARWPEVALEHNDYLDIGGIRFNIMEIRNLDFEDEWVEFIVRKVVD